MFSVDAPMKQGQPALASPQVQSGGPRSWVSKHAEYMDRSGSIDQNDSNYYVLTFCVDPQMPP